MKLYVVPYNSDIQLRDADGNTLNLRFHYLDGTYGYCTDKNNNPVHIALWSDVEVLDGQTI
jgi:hypothetical protein